MVTSSAGHAVLPGLGREVLGILRRRWLLAALPAAMLGGLADAILLLSHEIGAEIALGVLVAVAFEFYVAWAELVVAADRGEEAAAGVAAMGRRAAASLPALTAASLVAVAAPLAASGLLLLPGLWLLTRWSLFAPAIVHEGLGWRQAIARSAQLTRECFWAVAAAVTASVLVEHAVIHGTAHTAEPAFGSLALGLVGAALATALVSPAAAFTISVVYDRLQAAASS